MNDLLEASQLYASANMPAAEEKLKGILSSEPQNGEAKLMLGVVYAQTGRPLLAIEELEPVLAEYPDQLEALIWLAIVKQRIGYFEEGIALCERAIELNPEIPAALNTLGLCYLSTRRTPLAFDMFRKATILAPDLPASYHNLGLAFRLLDDAYGACWAFAKAVELDQDNEENYLQLFNEHVLLSAWDDAIARLEQGLQRLPNSLHMLEALAFSLCRGNQKERGENLFRQVYELNNTFCHPYAFWLQEEGRFSESVALMTHSLSVTPIQGMAYYSLAEAKKFQFDDGFSLIEKVTSILSNPRLDGQDHMYLAYALAKAHEKAGNFGEAIAHFDRANELAFQIFNEGRRLDHEANTAANDDLMKFFSSDFLNHHKQYGSSSKTPILIVGMIRTGTTLLNQIISNHPMVLSAGELPFWKLHGSRVSYFWQLNGVNLDDIAFLEREFLAMLRKVGGDAPRIIDKMPPNYRMLGLIHIVFPKAKVIHIRRNPVDTCLSIYCTHFGAGPSFAYNQENIVFHYREYLRIMEHWRSVLPAESLFELDYEDLIADKERVTREVIQYCGLPWDDSCLRHDGNLSTVSTPSKWQARQPIYSSSVEKWRKYEPWLGALVELRDVKHPPIIRANSNA